MTLESALIAAVGSVTGALVFVARILWTRSEFCEEDRRALRCEIEKLKAEHGVATGQLGIIRRCPEPTCPFRDPLGAHPVNPQILRL